MVTLSLDIATETGVGIIEDGKLIFSGNRIFNSKKENKYKAFDEFLDILFSNYLFDNIVTEMPAGRHSRSIITQSELVGILKLKAAYYDIKVTEVPVPSIKKFATGSGLASKDQMIEASRKYGYEGNNHNVADAILIGFYFINTVNIQ